MPTSQDKKVGRYPASWPKRQPTSHSPLSNAHIETEVACIWSKPIARLPQLSIAPVVNSCLPSFRLVPYSEVIAWIKVRLKGGDILNQCQSQFLIEWKEDCANERSRRAGWQSSTKEGACKTLQGMPCCKKEKGWANKSESYQDLRDSERQSVKRQPLSGEFPSICCLVHYLRS